MVGTEYISRSPFDGYRCGKFTWMNGWMDGSSHENEKRHEKNARDFSHLYKYVYYFHTLMVVIVDCMSVLEAFVYA